MPTRKLIKKFSLPNNHRLPRPAGATLLSKQYQEIRSDENKGRLYSHIISYYTLNGFRWNGKPTSLPELSLILKIPTSEIMEHVSKVSLNLGTLVNPEQIESTLKSIITLSASWSIQDRGIIQTQVETLLRSQAGTYKPFISSETTKAMKLLLESNKNLMEVYTTFFKTQNNTTNVLNIFNKANQDSNSLITPDQAINLIQNNKAKSLPAFSSDDIELTDNVTGIMNPDCLKKVYQDNAIGDLNQVLEGRTGTEALMPIPLPDDRALKLTEQEEAIKPEDKRSAASSRRRGLIEDTEEVPNRE